MSDEDRRAWDTAHASGQSAAEQARAMVEAGDKVAAERFLLEAAEQINAALVAIGSDRRIRIGDDRP